MSAAHKPSRAKRRLTLMGMAGVLLFGAVGTAAWLAGQGDLLASVDAKARTACGVPGAPIVDLAASDFETLGIDDPAHTPQLIGKDRDILTIAPVSGRVTHYERWNGDHGYTFESVEGQRFEMVPGNYTPNCAG